eukprot:1914364-Prymnesium_polylepis.1
MARPHPDAEPTADDEAADDGYYMTLDDGHGYAEHDDDAVEHAAALDETAPVGDAGADAAAAAPADG